MGPWVESALRDLGIELDERGLIPLDDARRRVREAKVFENGRSHKIPGQLSQPTDGDFLWGALLSLADVDEFVREATRITWKSSPAGFDNISPFERYGDAILPWLAHFISEKGELPPNPWCVLPCLVAIGNGSALEVLLRIRPGVNKSKVAKAIRETKARAGIITKVASDLTESAVLEVLDEAAASTNDTPLPWPVLGSSVGHFEPHAMRVIAARSKTGGDFGVLFEVVQGDRLRGPGESIRWPATIQQYRYGTRVPSGGEYLEDARPIGMHCKVPGESVRETSVTPASFEGMRVLGPKGTRPFTMTEAIAEQLDPGRSCSKKIEDWASVIAIRARLARDPNAFWTDPRALVKKVLDLKDPILVVATDRFEHVSGPGFGRGPKDKRLPSATIVFRSLAAALVHRDSRKFEPGSSNVDWRSQVEMTLMRSRSRGP